MCVRSVALFLSTNVTATSVEWRCRHCDQSLVFQKQHCCGRNNQEGID